jgi:N-acetylglutamate synthase-like GNAT family acetyltransferase
LSAPVRIRPWREPDTAAIVELIVGIQRGEFELDITAADQPDLADIAGFYLDGGGQFWVAERDGAVVGTIAAIAIDPTTAVIRKMFLDASARGSGLADDLMRTLADWAGAAGFTTLLLGTTAVMDRAQRFYVKHGFDRIEADDLPSHFPRMAVDSVFFRRSLV